MATEAPNKRKPISKKMRFEVFKRDSFTCQYCGKSAPNVVLHVDHINPVSKGGKHEIINFITACVHCNLGKGARCISDDSAISKQIAQMQLLNERREQMKLMLAWREELSELDNLQVDVVGKEIYFNTEYQLNEHGRADVKKWVNKYGLSEVLEAVNISRGNYLETENGSYTETSIDKAFDYIPKICNCRRIDLENPHIKQLNYIKAIVRNRCNYYNPNRAAQIVNKAYEIGVTIEEMSDIAKQCRHWSGWQSDMQDAIEYQES